MIITQNLSRIETDPGLAARTAQLIHYYGNHRMQAAMAYMKSHPDETNFTRDGVIYCPVTTKMDLGTTRDEWESTKQDLLRAIGEFRPDVIHCFGSEWIFSAVVRDVSVPVVIHMMGFLTIYHTTLDLLPNCFQSDEQRKKGQIAYALRKLKHPLYPGKRQESGEDDHNFEAVNAIEQDIMGMNRYFMGRTEWDRNIVRYYSPGAKYYRVQEAVKPAVYGAAGQWRHLSRQKLHLLTISSADDRKGNGIILRTAKLLRDLLGLDFAWKVAGNRECFSRYEQITGIRCDDVNIELTGPLENDRIIYELKNADMFIHPSAIDNSPHSVCEAQLIGCPVIASNVGGVPDLVEDGVTGFLYPYNEPHTLAFLIGNLHLSPELLTSVSHNSCSAALERHDPFRIAETLYAAYKDIIDDYEKR